jgi:hypothetical protein
LGGRRDPLGLQPGPVAATYRARSGFANGTRRQCGSKSSRRSVGSRVARPSIPGASRVPAPRADRSSSTAGLCWGSGVPGTPHLTQRPSLGAGFLPSQDPARVLFERRRKRLVSQRSAGALVGTQESTSSSLIARARARQLRPAGAGKPPAPACRPVRAHGRRRCSTGNGLVPR